MAVTWTIGTMERDLVQGDNTDIVTTLHWRASDEDADGNTGSAYGTVGVTLVGTPTPYADITEEQAIGWAKDALGEDEVASIEAGIASKIDAMANPTTASGVTW
jgi:predicted sugar kinase